MSESPLPIDAAALDSSADLQTVLNAWHTATLRLEQTHQSLREEVGRLTDELEDKNRELARKDRLADMGQVAAHVAHEVRNSLVPVTLYLSLLRRRISDDSGSLSMLDKIEAGFTALNVAINDLLHFTAEREPAFMHFILPDLIEEVLCSLAPQLAAQGIETTLDIPSGQPISADREMIRRTVLNLVLNAMDAMQDGGSLVITSSVSPWGLELEIADSGPGLPEETLQHAFDPFYTTKEDGLGMGLAISRKRVPGEYSLTYYAPQPRAILRVVDPDAPEELVEYGEYGRVELTTMTKEFFMPRFLERDEAIRREPCDEFSWDGVGDVRPFQSEGKAVIEGVY